MFSGILSQVINVYCVEALDRPSQELFYPGSDIDRTWRYGMLDFLLGALAQTIKVFAIKGTPTRNALVAVYLFAYIIPELFRLIAGPSGTVELHPLSIVNETKEFLHGVKVAWMGSVFTIYLICGISVS